MVLTSWLMGSAMMAEQTFTVDVSGAEIYTLAEGLWYPYHEVNGSSLLYVIEDALEAEGLTASCYIDRNRRVHLDGSGTFSLSWTSSTQLRDMLGFTANLTGAATYTAPNISSLLFSPGYPATRPVTEGVAGYSVEDVRIEIDRSGTLVNTTYNNRHVLDELQWSGVTLARTTTTDVSVPAAGGTWRRFRRQVFVPNYPWRHYELVDEDGTTDPVSLSSPLGTYKARELPSDIQDRRITNANSRWSFGVKAIRLGD